MLILKVLFIRLLCDLRRLEYKYSKLVESAGGRDGELPGVESCGMEEGEEEESVHFADSKGPRLLQKIRLKISGIKNKVKMRAAFQNMASYLSFESELSKKRVLHE